MNEPGVRATGPGEPCPLNEPGYTQAPIVDRDPGDENDALDHLEATEPDDPESALDFPELRK